VEKNRRLQKRIGVERVQILLSNAMHYASIDPEISRKQLEVARRILLKFNLRVPYPDKLFYCRKCRSPLLIGIDSNVRIVNSPKLHIRVSCRKCGNVYKKFLD
jgi:ribonuclease P protein subunit RPR2